MTRGYAAIGLWRPKCEANVGGVLRAAQCFGAATVLIAGGRYHRSNTDTMKAFRHIPVCHVKDLLESKPLGCVTVAVEKIDPAWHMQSCPMPSYVHPERALYIFGPEDGSLDKATLAACDHRIVIPMERCLNLSAAVNIDLYDLAANRARTERRGAWNEATARTA
jgi:tRNA(Leu) C34 or U34 (ribose-2'-O)-methylase TrmL